MTLPDNLDNDFPVRQAATCVKSFASAMAEEIAACERVDFIAPDYEDYRLIVPTSGSVLIGTDLRIAPGVYLPVEGRLLTYDLSRQLQHIRGGLRALLSAVSGDVAEVLDLRAQIEHEAHRMMAAANRDGLDARILSVALAPVFLNAQDAKVAIEVIVEGATCNMLRPYRETHRVKCIEELNRVFEDLTGELKPIRSERRQAVGALGAVGYIDNVALAIVDTLPEGREATLARIARNYEHNVWLDRGEDRPQANGLRWYDGVVRAYAPLTSTCHREWDTIDIGETSPDLVGQPASVLGDHPALAGLRIEEVIDQREVRVTDVLLPFTARGQVLGD